MEQELFYLFNKVLLSTYYLMGTVLDIGNPVVKDRQGFCCCGLYVLAYLAVLDTKYTNSKIFLGCDKCYEENQT